MPSSPSSGRIPWHALFIAALTLGLLWLSFRHIDLHEAWAALKQAHRGRIALATLVVIQTYVLRACRWRALLAPIGPARFRTVFRTTIIGFATSFLLPFRPGEVLKPYLLAREEGLNVASTMATVLVERLLDTLTVLSLFGTATFVAGVDVGPRVRAVGMLAAAVSVASAVLLVFLAGHPERLGRWVARLGHWLPARFSVSLAHVGHTFAEGLKVMRSPAQLFWGCVWSVPLWLSIALGIWLTSLAFDLTLSYVASFLVVGYLSVGVLAPTPGAAGGFHLAYETVMTQLFGAPASVAASAAMVLYLISLVPVILLGLAFMWQDGLTLGGLKRFGQQVRSETAGG